MARINKIGIAQTTKFFVVFYLVASLIFMVPMFLFTLFIGSIDGDSLGPIKIFGGIFMLVMPIIYALIGGFMVALMSFFYNLIAKFVGGVEFEIEENNENHFEKSQSAQTTTAPSPET